MATPITRAGANADFSMLSFEVDDIGRLHAALQTPEQLSLRCSFERTDIDVESGWLQIDVTILEGRLALEFSSSG